MFSVCSQSAAEWRWSRATYWSRWSASVVGRGFAAGEDAPSAAAAEEEGDAFDDEDGRDEDAAGSLPLPFPLDAAVGGRSGFVEVPDAGEEGLLPWELPSAGRCGWCFVGSDCCADAPASEVSGIGRVWLGSGVGSFLIHRVCGLAQTLLLSWVVLGIVGVIADAGLESCSLSLGVLGGRCRGRRRSWWMEERQEAAACSMLHNKREWREALDHQRRRRPTNEPW